MHTSHLAVQARTAVDQARFGTLTTYARLPSTPHATCVAVEAGSDGSAEVELAKDAIAVRQILARPLASLRVAPVGCEPVLLHGAAYRRPGITRQGRLRFHLQAAAVRVGSPPQLVDEASYAAAEPDPLRHDAWHVLAHLNDGHADALATCLSAGGHDVGFVQATRLDAGGLTVLAVHDGGVDTVRLSFPAPVRDLRELPPSLRGVLSPRCGCGSRPPTGDSGTPSIP